MEALVSLLLGMEMTMRFQENKKLETVCQLNHLSDGDGAVALKD